MKSVIPVTLMMIIFAAISFAAVNMDDKEPITAEAKKISLKTYTAAVCEDKESHVYCKDEFFVNCNGNVWIAKNTAECGGVKIQVPSAMGAAVFDRGWKDPRISEQI